MVALQLSGDPTLSSLPLLTTFLKSYSLPFLGITPPAMSKQVSSNIEPGSMSNGHANAQAFPTLNEEQTSLVEPEIRDRFKRMCEKYFENVSKKLVIEHKVVKSQVHTRSGNSPLDSAYKIKTAAIMKHIYGLVKSSRTASKHTRK